MNYNTLLILTIIFFQSCKSYNKISYNNLLFEDCDFEVVRELSFDKSINGGYAPPNFKTPYVNEYKNFYKETDSIPFMHFYTLISNCYGAGVQSIFNASESECREIYFKGDSTNLYKIDTVIILNPITLEKTIKEVEEYYYRGKEIYDTGWYPCTQIKKVGNGVLLPR